MRKKIYLTIDDSPSSSFRKNLDYLIAHKIPAVFFCIGSLMEAHWSDILFAIEQGYHIGNHSYSHPHFSDLELKTAKNEIERTDSLIETAYREAGVADYDRLFRFPYGDKGDGKYGYQFMEFKKANQLRQGRFQKLMNKVQLIHPLHRFIDGKQEEIGRERAQAIQQYLFKLGYVRGDLKGVEYDFFHSLETDQDWSWSFDIAEWQWNEKQNKDKFLKEIVERLDNENPSDFRGDVLEKTGMQQKDKIDLVLFHDRDATNNFFIPILEHLRKIEVDFLPIEYDQIKMDK